MNLVVLIIEMSQELQLHAIELGIILLLLVVASLLLSPIYIFSDVVFVVVFAIIGVGVLILLISESFDVWKKYRNIEEPEIELEDELNSNLDEISQSLSESFNTSLAEIIIIDSNDCNSYIVNGLLMKPKIVFTTNLISLLSEDELTAVMAHGYSHIRTNDNLFMLCLWQLFLYVIYSRNILRNLPFKKDNEISQIDSETKNNEMGDLIETAAVFLITLPFIAVLTIIELLLSSMVYLISQSRELLADEDAVAVTSKNTVESVLEKLYDETDGYTDMKSLEGAESFLPVQIFSTTFLNPHPSLEGRIQHLEEISEDEIQS